MDEFAQALLNYLPEFEMPKIKVALIDDEIQPEKIPFRVACGRSFSPNENEDDLDNYYADAGPHGTIMAQQIHRICPEANLYIARIVPTESGLISPNAAAKVSLRNQNISSQKAFLMNANGFLTQAVRWAIEEEVDIISMSWTFNKAEHEGDVEEFRRAIESARSKIMFGSLRERERTL
jgi:hypothetical protein